MTTWTDHLRALAVKRWSAGESFGAVAHSLGVTRSAVMGVIWRYEARHGRVRAADSRGVPRSGHGSPHVGNSSQVIYRAPDRPLAPLPGALAGTSPRMWTERRPGECAYPVAGSGDTTVSCCAPVRTGPYCDTHRARMYVAPPPRVRVSRPPAP